MKKILFIFGCLLNLSNLYLNGEEQIQEIDKHAKIYVAGHKGLVGAAIVDALKAKGYDNIIGRTHSELELKDQAAVNSFFKQERPEYVFLAAAKVGGIYANNTYPGEFIYDNLMVTANVIHAAYKYGVKKLLYLGSSCIYPRNCPQPIKEEYLLTSVLEKTNEPYAIAKIAGLKMCQTYNRQYNTRFISCMPTNLYGNNDNFDFNTSHVIPGLIAKFCQAQEEGKEEVICWGTGKACREFLHVRDLAQATVFLMNNYEEYGENSWINVGTGEDITINELIQQIKEIVGFKGRVIYDSTKPDGTPKKLLDVNRIKALGWKAEISLREGLEETIRFYKEKKLSKDLLKSNARS